MVTFRCPRCRRVLRVPEELAGRRARCPLCAQLAVVPAARPITAAPDCPPVPGSPLPLVPPAYQHGAEGATPLPTVTARGDRPGVILQRGNPADPEGTTPLFVSRPGEGYDFLAPPQGPEELGRLGPYRVLKLLGAGSMGVVFQAEDPMLRRAVALKALSPALAADPVHRRRFLREAQAAAAVEHDHVVAVHHVGEDRGVPFLVMPLLRGESLGERLRREGPLPCREVLRVGREIAEGLAAAHELGLIHRDVKPSNVWLEGESGRVKILDFGLARAAAEESRLTRTGTVVGTPGYMPPEQACGARVDARGDLFSLGCVLYLMSIGRAPFTGKDATALLAATVSEDPPPVRQLRPDVPPALAELVKRLLAKDRDRRPSSARAVAQAIAAIERESAGISATPLSDAARWSATTAEADTLAAPFPPERPEALIGRMLGPYHVGRILGRGAHGTVYRARDLTADRVVALKVLSPEFPLDDEEARRFLRVMQAMRNRRHANIVGVHAAGRTGPYCWVALEYVRAVSLARVVEGIAAGKRKACWRRAFRVALGLARALEFAERHRLTHGGITPWNLLWQRGDRTARLSGLMSREALAGSRLWQVRREERRRAELPYRAPERRHDDSGKADMISDLYSVGAVVYALLTGRPPSEQESPEGTARQARPGVPVRPTSWQRNIPADFEWAVRTLLAGDRGFRYQSPAELLESLEHVALQQGLAF